MIKVGFAHRLIADLKDLLPHGFCISNADAHIAGKMPIGVVDPSHEYSILPGE